MSRNRGLDNGRVLGAVAPREGRVSRNNADLSNADLSGVAPREGRVSRNPERAGVLSVLLRRAPRGACE